MNLEVLGPDLAKGIRLFFGSLVDDLKPNIAILPWVPIRGHKSTHFTMLPLEPEVRTTGSQESEKTTTPITTERLFLIPMGITLRQFATTLLSRILSGSEEEKSSHNRNILHKMEKLLVKL